MRQRAVPFRTMREVEEWQADLDARMKQALLRALDNNNEVQKKIGEAQSELNALIERKKGELAEVQHKDSWRMQELLEDASVPSAPVRQDVTGMQIAKTAAAIILAGVAVGIFVFLWMFQ